MKEQQEKGQMRSTFGFLLRYYRPYRWSMILALTFMVPSSGVSLLFPMLTGNIIDQILANSEATSLMNTGGLFLGLLTAQAIVGYVVSVTLSRTTERVIASIRSDLYEHIVRLPLSRMSGHRVGELSSRLSSDMTQIQETFSFSLLQLVRQSIFLVGSIVLILATSVRLTMPIIIGMPIIVGAGVLIGRRLRKLSTRTQDALARTSTIIEESLQSISAVKSYVQEPHEIRRYSDSLGEYVGLAVKGARLRAGFVTFIIFTVFGGIAAVILYGARLVESGDLRLGELLSFLMYAMFVGGALGSFAELYGQIQKSLGSAVRIREIMAEPTEEVGCDQPAVRLSSIELDSVSFRYPDRQDMLVVNSISINIKAGERVAFVGESGSGKSTTAALLQRLYDPTLGTIRYNGFDAASYSRAQVRRSVGVVPQDIVLFGGTIEENIRYGRPEASFEDVRKAAADANALDFIERFPEGFGTLVGERGLKLSGGQRQRVAIARALLKNPSILILDEATSSLDAESEHLIQDALERLMADRTTVIIAHRLSTVRTCDRIFVFSAGSVIESGTHDELLRIGGLYSHWCDLQFIR
ncbi:MAG: ABC transporter ATP-binding protein [Candidatus Kapabacteria bacterium]|nr:ABC transporter ATP-binding protein [Candidatus Kapabacteria bacterium]